MIKNQLKKKRYTNLFLSEKSKKQILKHMKQDLKKNSVKNMKKMKMKRFELKKNKQDWKIKKGNDESNLSFQIRQQFIDSRPKNKNMKQFIQNESLSKCLVNILFLKVKYSDLIMNLLKNEIQKYEKEIK
jgi:hypothetical protein